jgi:hypothetical protein
VHHTGRNMERLVLGKTKTKKMHGSGFSLYVLQLSEFMNCLEAKGFLAS